jgi:N utilization substance protein B
VAELVVLEVLGGETDVATFTRERSKGSSSDSAELDDLIRHHTDRWALERMPISDRNPLRIGIFELLYRPDVPPAAASNEAVELAKLLSAEDSGRFVNGLLGRVSREHARA